MPARAEQASLVAQTVKNLPATQETFDPWVGKTSWRREKQPTPVLLPGKSHGQRSLAGYSLWGYKQSDTTERLTHTDTRLNRWDHLLNEKFGVFFHIMCKYVLVAVMLLKLQYAHLSLGILSEFKLWFNRWGLRFLTRCQLMLVVWTFKVR